MNRFKLVIFVLIASLVLAGVPVAAQDAPIRIALVLPGGINDQGFNQSAYEGLLRIEDELGAEVAYSEETPVDNFHRVYRDFADEEFDVIIGHGFQFGEVAMEIAQEYPDALFVVTNNPGMEGAPDNLAFIQPVSKDSAFLAGVAAGLATETNVIGAIGGFDFPIIVAQVEAFKLGARAVNPDADVRAVYVGTFYDAAVGKEAAEALIVENADVIYHIADAAGLGAIQAAEEAGVWAIGWGLDQQAIAPGTMLTTQIVDTGGMLVSQIQTIIDGEFTSGSTFYGLSSGVVDLAPLDSAVEDWTTFTDDLSTAIEGGLIMVPFMPEAGLSDNMPGGWLALPDTMGE